MVKSKERVAIKKVKPKLKKKVKRKKKIEKKKVALKKEKKVIKAKVSNIVKPTPLVQKKQVENKSVIKQPRLATPSSKVVKNPTVVKTLSAQEQYIKENLAKIRTLLQENLYYPRRARKRGKEGVVKIKFRLSKSAEISNIQIIESKSDILSHGAIKTLESLSFKLPPPKEELILNVPISYKLR